MPTVHDYKTAIIELITRRGKLEKELLHIGVCQNLGIDVSEYNEKTFYRHMGQLVDDGKLDCNMPNGRKQWSIPGESKKIPNAGLISEHNGLLHVPPGLKIDASIVQGKQPHYNNNEIHIYFNLNHEFLCLKVDKGAFPFGLHLARKTDQQDSKIVEKIKSSHGTRAITLHLPIAKLSSIKDSGDSGHAYLKFSEDGIVVKDLNSTNGSDVSRVSYKQCEHFLNSADLIGKQTVTEDEFRKGIGSVEFETIPSGESIEYDYPVLAQFSTDFKVLVYLPEN